jgi:hypothetical protein
MKRRVAADLPHTSARSHPHGLAATRRFARRLRAERKRPVARRAHKRAAQRTRAATFDANLNVFRGGLNLKF